ncbi:MAG: hypothetical protein AAGH42_07400 [Pseudomonadota bacterium]
MRNSFPVRWRTATWPDIPLTDNYIFIDWGQAFRNAHAEDFPALHNPGLTLDLGALGVQMLINQQGAGYFPERVVQPHLEAGHLTQIEGYPDYAYPAYLVYQANCSTSLVMTSALTSLRQVAAQAIDGDLPPPFWG